MKPVGYWSMRSCSTICASWSIAAKEAGGAIADAAFLRTISPVAWHHINFGGRITFYEDQPPAPIVASVAAVLAYRRSAAEHRPDDESPQALVEVFVDDTSDED